jgi:hypothetical protein
MSLPLAKFYVIDLTTVLTPALAGLGLVAVLIVAAIGFILWAAFRNRR